MKYLLLLFTLFFALGSEIAFGQSQNYLINGGFDLWQRGTTNAAVDAYGYLADRWFATAGTYDQNASNLPTGQKYGAQLAFSSSSGWLCQRIEADNIRFLSGQKMTVSGYERSSTGTGPLKLKIDRPNTVDDYSGMGKNGVTLTNEIAATTLIATTSTALTEWRYLFTVSSNMATYGFQICLGTDTSTTTTYQISKVMLNEGFKKLSFRRSGGLISEELRIAQRYYESGFDVGLAGDSIGQSRTPYAYFKTTKRIVPTVGACGGSWFQTNGTNQSFCGVAEYHVDGISFLGPGNSGWTFASISWSVNVEL